MRKAIEEAKKFVCTTKDRIVKDAKDFVSNVDWDKVAQGAMVVAGGALVIAVGVGAIVSTGGLAAPAIAGLLAGSITTTNVMVAGTLAAGVVATGFGASDVIEGIQDLGNGVTENSEKVAFNPIRDTVFKNEPELYYLTETVVTYGAGAGTQMVNSMKVQETPSSGQSSSSNTTSGGRLGNDATRKQNSEIAEYLKGEGYEITGGGGLTKEEYLPSLDGGRKGSNYVDITATKNGETIRINTVDTYANGTPTTREQNAAQMINSKTPNDRNIILIPKGDGLGNLPDIIGGK